MALTPEDVRNKLFTTVRLREGYDQTEVDEFLDQVEAELMRLHKENDELRAGSPTGTADGAATAPVAKSAPSTEAAAVTPARQPPREVVVRTAGEVSSAAAKVLELAQQTADQFLSEAREEADRLVTDATAEAERLSTEARTKADEVDRQTHERTTALEGQLAEQRKTVLDRLQEEKRRLESEVETLRSFEREYRGRLRTFLEGQLEQLAVRTDGDTPLAPEGGPPARSAPASHASAGPVAADGQVSEQAAEGESSDEPAAGQQEAGAAAGNGAPAAAAPRRSALGRILDEEERKS